MYTATHKIVMTSDLGVLVGNLDGFLPTLDHDSTFVLSTTMSSNSTLVLKFLPACSCSTKERDYAGEAPEKLPGSYEVRGWIEVTR